MGKICDFFKTVSKDGKICHAFLIGNTTLNECKNDLEEAISNYIYNTKISLDNDPDTYIVKAEGNSITKNQIKTLLQNIATTSQFHGKKVYVITECEKLSETVYNTLLKTIEEPSENVYAFLISSNIDNVGDTIKSRCQILFISSNSCRCIDENINSIAQDIVYKVDKNSIYTIAKNNDIYKKVKSKDDLKKIINEIFYIYMNKLFDIIEDEKKKEELDLISKKIIVVNKMIEKNNININKDLCLDKLIIELWRCNNENSISGI